ncbi:hypothetical protein BS1321_20490 [Peribacillus simplex NBRC 15720 = DSM 1321]|uniref:Uncharacterized protein n=1 Tax=Peribacillus simplex NBRC 15720 = DSM 1321 TaxID=1349754 RepID=A0A223ELG1_9BACI|nr:hypothetical protein BS1321_20490 [Peribacillus simplex NBRC 15720 = DSM 1321]
MKWRGRSARGKRVQKWKSTIPQKDCRQKEFYLTIKTKLIGAEGTRLLREKRVQGRPRRREAARADRPRKASAWSGNQQSLKKTVGKRSSILLLKLS